MSDQTTAAGTPAPAASPIGSPNTSTDETLKIVAMAGALAQGLAPLGDQIAILAGADAEDVKVGTTAALQFIPGLEQLIASLIKLFG